MEEAIKAIIVGIVQGLTEFLPISSSGHILIAQEMLGLDFGEDNLLFSIVLHLATALSTIFVFRKDILSIIGGLLQFRWNSDMRFALMVIVSMVPAALVGLYLVDLVETLFTSLVTVGTMLLVTGSLLFFADRVPFSTRALSFRGAVTIGVAQGFAALLPGLSRSGATICTAILIGNEKSQATRFSFLMVLPLILGASAKMAMDIPEGSALTGNIRWETLALGFLAAFGSGIVACRWMIGMVRRAKLSYFSIYCFIVGIVVLLYVYMV